jgi:NAD+ diphosphatase
MPYPESINLPFNFSSISTTFRLLPPRQSPPTDAGRWVIIQGGSVIVEQYEDTFRLPEGDLPDWLAGDTSEALSIGYWHDSPVRVISVSSKLTIKPPYVSEAFNANENRLDIQTLTIAGLAKQILHWEKLSKHCPRCGSGMTPIPGSWGKSCSSCNAEHFPHIHPCAIVLVKRGDEILLTRKPEWAAGRYGLVAGFLDMGESLEECAVREVREETGITICNVRYVGSQNWPFPAQLMAGFVADYKSGEIIVDKDELEDARWFRRDQLPNLPSPRSIARWVIDNFA